ncbi:MAG TPA: dATP/dGTP diphosphohydrolase domain-containing protein [Gammaproteobacteria bacterium]|nr:dATP/dGTP diphosphohydrolase domain-containing protein [Gammaproteobacteria bacterium]
MKESLQGFVGTQAADPAPRRRPRPAILRRKQTTNPQDVLVRLPKDARARKDRPLVTGLLDYFPAALAEVAKVSKAGNDQHNPGQPIHWARGKSTDHADCLVRHLMERGTYDTDDLRHTAKVAWRALALLQEEIEADAGFVPVPSEEPDR